VKTVQHRGDLMNEEPPEEFVASAQEA